jgi:hypothetical protein
MLFSSAACPPAAGAGWTFVLHRLPNLHLRSTWYASPLTTTIYTHPSDEVIRDRLRGRGVLTGRDPAVLPGCEE